MAKKAKAKPEANNDDDRFELVNQFITTRESRDLIRKADGPYTRKFLKAKGVDIEALLRRDALIPEEVWLQQQRTARR